jgi:hypothetical protein
MSAITRHVPMIRRPASNTKSSIVLLIVDAMLVGMLCVLFVVAIVR